MPGTTCVFASTGARFTWVIYQSFAKNAGLYSERIGVLHIISPDQDTANRVKSQLSVMQRSEISNPPSYGARIVSGLLLLEPRMTNKSADGADPEQRGVVRGLETGHQDDGTSDHLYARGAVPIADGGTEDAGQVGPHYEADWHVQVCCEDDIPCGC